jgi:hypothetical protein
MPREEFAQIGDLQLDEDLPFLRRSWRVQRIAWVLMVLILGAALAGAFGRGPLSKARASSDDGSLLVEYERVLRQKAPVEFRIRFDPGSDGVARLSLNRDCLRKLRVESIVPEPESEIGALERTTFTFRGAGRAEAVMRFEAEEFGQVKPELTLERSGTAPQTVRLGQFILP